MIIDRFERLLNYRVILKNIDKALSKLEEISDWQEGKRYSFDGGFLFFQKGQTKRLVDAQFEAHERYIDVQILLKGAEYVALEDLKNLRVTIPYDPEKDVAKYDGETKHFMKVEEGMVYVCFPWDAHQAVFHIEQPLSFTKVVIKLEI